MVLSTLHRRRGTLTAFVERHAVAWETAMAAITIIYVFIAIWDDDFGGRIPGVALVTLAVILITEFSLRFWDSRNRWQYLRHHWIDVVACIPVIGGLRLLRLLRIVRLVAGLRLMSTIERNLSVRQIGRGSLWFLAPALVFLWAGSAYAIWALEHGVNPGIKTFGDALYWSAITITTIGYGDVAPVTVSGRVVAGLLAFTGIGLFGFVSAQLTAHLVGQTDRTADEIAQLRQEIAGLRRELGSVAKDDIRGD